MLSISFSAPRFGNQKQSTSLPDDSMQLLYCTNPKPVAQIMKYYLSGYHVLCILSQATTLELNYPMYYTFAVCVCLIVE